MEDLKKQLPEIESSGIENSKSIIKLVAAFKDLLTKTNDNEKQMLELEIISDSLKHRLKSNEKCFIRSIEEIEEKLERLASQFQNMKNHTGENGENKRIDKDEMLKIERISDSLEKRLELNEQRFSRSIEMIEEKMERLACQLQNIENQTGENKRIDKDEMLEIEKRFKESIENFERKMAIFSNQLPNAKPTGENDTVIDLEFVEVDKRNNPSNKKQQVDRKKLLRLREKSYDYFTKMSIPGIPSIFNTENLYFKVLWAILVLTSFSVGFYNIADLAEGFYKHEVITNVKRTTEKNFTFPAITICTSGSMKISHIINDSFIDTNSENFYDILSMKDFYYDGYFRYEAIDNKLDYFKIPLYELICMRYNGATNHQLVHINKTNEDLLFKFNDTYIQTIGENGFINVYKYFIETFFVYIEDNYLNAFGQNPLFLKACKIHFLTIIKSETEAKLSEPYNSCKETKTDLHYHQMNCIESCIFNNIGITRNCTLNDSLFKVSGLNECPRFDFGFVRQDYLEDCEKKCLPSCESVKFSSQMAQFDYDDPVNSQTIIKFVVSDLSSLSITQIPKKTTFEFISADIGGALGLFMGISFLNFIEIFEFIVDIFSSLIAIKKIK